MLGLNSSFSGSKATLLLSIWFFLSVSGCNSVIQAQSFAQPHWVHAFPLSPWMCCLRSVTSVSWNCKLYFMRMCGAGSTPAAYTRFCLHRCVPTNKPRKTPWWKGEGKTPISVDIVVFTLYSLSLSFQAVTSYINRVLPPPWPLFLVLESILLQDIGLYAL